jgi:hypothetical protein
VKRTGLGTVFWMVLVIGVIGCAGERGGAGAPDIAREVAAAYGVQEFHRVEALRFTFNALIGDKTVRRAWQWEPKGDRVTFFGADGPVSFERRTLSDASSEELRKLDAAFINDQYWLLFPLHLVWDADLTLADLGLHPLPLGGGSARRLVVTYPPSTGYTPGDVYELFVAEDNRIRQWVYRRGGSPEPTRTATWEDHRALGPLVLSLDHKVPDGTFRVWFSEVALRLAESPDWLTP